jgi:hypothetical protein
LEEELNIAHVSYEQQQERLRQQEAQRTLEEALKDDGPYGVLARRLLNEFRKGFENACLR